MNCAVEVTNAGSRAGHETVQLYLEGPADGPTRPVRWLAGFTGVDAEPGETAVASATIDRRAFEVWDVASNGAFTQPIWLGDPQPAARAAGR